MPGVTPVHRAGLCASDTVHRSIAWAETGLIVVLEGLVGEFLCFVQLEAPFALWAGGFLVLAPVRCKPIWPSTNCVPTRAVGGCLGDTREVYHLRHRIDHPEFLPQGFEVVLDDLSDLFGFVVFLTSMVAGGVGAAVNHSQEIEGSRRGSRGISSVQDVDVGRGKGRGLWIDGNCRGVIL